MSKPHLSLLRENRSTAAFVSTGSIEQASQGFRMAKPPRYFKAFQKGGRKLFHRNPH
jgi:hypothetical protein